MTAEQKTAELWVEIEKQAQPKYIKSITEYSWEEFSSRIQGGDFPFISSLVEKLYGGDVMILRSALSKAEATYVKDSALEFGRNHEPSFHKVFEGCPDFHRISNPDIAKNAGYGFYRAQHLYYFHRWNRSSLFELADRTWEIFKLLCGWPRDRFRSATPQDGLVDRLHIHHYPSGTGEQESHQDPYRAQKMVMGHMLSEKGPGKEYGTGGIYYVSENGSLVDVDSELRIGDAYISFPLLVHGVARIDPEMSTDWSDRRGRWFMGFYTLHSDHVEKRHTGWAYPVEAAPQY
jgi:hypothetical protein